MKTLFLLIIINVTSILGYKILMVCPPPAKSHHKLCRGITDILHEAGHNVTLLSAFAKENSTYREIGVPDMEKAFLNSALPGFQIGQLSKLELMKSITELQPLMAKAFFESKSVKTFMKDKTESYDLVIVEYFLTDYLLGFSVKYNCPAIVLSPVALMSWLAVATGNTLSTEIVPNSFTAYPENMNLWQRTANTIILALQELLAKFLINPALDNIYRKYFPAESKRVPFDELKYTIKATFINSHPSIGVARPLLPNAIEIGGYHIDKTEELSDDIEDALESAENGAIYFSMGSNLKSSEMTDEIKSTILQTLGSLKQTVLWKYEEDIPNKPKNVIIDKWLPQTGILAHPNVKLFISHAGYLSCTEASHFGVPLLMIPIFGDQHFNARRVENAGNGLVLNYENITRQSFEWAIKEILTNKRYNESAKRIQNLYFDRPMNPRFSVAYYANHVIDSKGAPHLQAPRLSRCSQLLLDVGFVILTPIIIFAYLTIFCCRKCMMVCFKSKEKTNHKKQIDIKKKKQ